MVYGAVRVSCDLFHFAVFQVYQYATTSVTHPAMTFDDGIIAVNFHFSFDIRISKFSHKRLQISNSYVQYHYIPGFCMQ